MSVTSDVRISDQNNRAESKGKERYRPQERKTEAIRKAPQRADGTPANRFGRICVHGVLGFGSDDKYAGPDQRRDRSVSAQQIRDPG